LTGAALRAGAVYFAIVFALGFALGTARVLMLAPSIGETAAVAVETPLMVLASWLACGWIVAKFKTPRAWPVRATMGAAAFALLMAAEFSLSVFAFGRTPGDHLETYTHAPAQIGLLAQILFALFPLIRR
jgi:hypothetical protein